MFKRFMNDEPDEFVGGGEASNASSDSSSELLGIADKLGFNEPDAEQPSQDSDVEKILSALRGETAEEDSQAPQSQPTTKWLEEVNKLGIIHDDKPISIDSPDKLKELVSKGYDYTHKTQALASERKEWDAIKEKAIGEYNKSIEDHEAKVQQFESQLRDLQIWNNVVDQLKEQDPDLYSDLVAIAKKERSQFENPVINSMMSNFQKEINQLKEQQKAREMDMALQKFDVEAKTNKELIDQVESVGLKVDLAKVKDTWAKQGCTFKEALGMLYADKILTLQKSKAKVGQAQVKAGRSMAGGSSRSAVMPVKNFDKKLSYQQLANQLATF
jgi:hypothetical protein